MAGNIEDPEHVAKELACSTANDSNAHQDESSQSAPAKSSERTPQQEHRSLWKVRHMRAIAVGNVFFQIQYEIDRARFMLKREPRTPDLRSLFEERDFGTILQWETGFASTVVGGVAAGGSQGDKRAFHLSTIKYRLSKLDDVERRNNAAITESPASLSDTDFIVKAHLQLRDKIKNLRVSTISAIQDVYMT